MTMTTATGATTLGLAELESRLEVNAVLFEQAVLDVGPWRRDARSLETEMWWGRSSSIQAAWAQAMEYGAW